MCTTSTLQRAYASLTLFTCLAVNLPSPQRQSQTPFDAQSTRGLSTAASHPARASPLDSAHNTVRPGSSLERGDSSEVVSTVNSSLAAAPAASAGAGIPLRTMGKIQKVGYVCNCAYTWIVCLFGSMKP